MCMLIFKTESKLVVFESQRDMSFSEVKTNRADDKGIEGWMSGTKGETSVSEKDTNRAVDNSIEVKTA